MLHANRIIIPYKSPTPALAIALVLALALASTSALIIASILAYNPCLYYRDK